MYNPTKELTLNYITISPSAILGKIGLHTVNEDGVRDIFSELRGGGGDEVD